MIRRILAIITSIVVAVSMFSFSVNAEDKTEPSIKVEEWWGDGGSWQYNSVTGHDENDTMVLEATSTVWGTINCRTIVSGLDSAETYTFSAWIKGDWSSMNFGVKQYETAEVLGADWRQITFEFSGVSNLTLSAQLQSASGYMGGTAYLDDVVVKNSAQEEVFSEDFETATPPPAPTRAPQPVDPPDSDKIRIMCIGDSITHGGIVGDTDEQSYRYPLWKKLIDAEIDFEFVGSVTTSFGTQQTYEDYKGLQFPNIHEGYWGWTIQGVTPKIKASMESGNLPDIAIINLGTNDEGENETVASKKAAMGVLIDTMREIKPDVKFILAGPFSSWFGDLRAAYTDLANTKSTTNSPIIVTTQPAIIDDPTTAGSWTEDWVHTSRIGDEGTAEVIFDALMVYIGGGEISTPEPIETPEPDLEETPVVEGTPAVESTPVATVDGTPATTVAPTVTPSTSATAKPTKKPVKKKVTIKFKKKSVKIKKGKKVTLKVTIKNAKKAKFSVNKKGKKVVKLSKKKAKSVVVKGKKKGKATITAKAGSKKAACKVKVK